jgi:hypothetical protein
MRADVNSGHQTIHAASCPAIGNKTKAPSCCLAISIGANQKEEVMKKWLFVLIVCMACLFSGCISSRSFVDTSFKKANFADIVPNTLPKKATVSAEFQRNGVPLPAVSPTIKAQIVKTLTATKVFEPIETDVPEADKLFFVMNNIVDLDNARKQGFKTGFTFGGAGSLISDNYAFTGKVVSANGITFASEYKHALHTALGKTETPPGLKPTTVEAGVNEIIDDLVLNFLKDYQANSSNTLRKTEQ